MKRLGILMLVCWVWGCGEKPDVLTPYIEKLKTLHHYNETLAKYQTYLTTEGMTSLANDVEQVLQNYRRDLEAIGKPDDKRIRALHNEMIRKIDDAMRKLVEPDFPTFVPNAQKAIKLIEEETITNYNNFERMWKDAGKTEPFPLQWPEKE